MAIDWQKKKYLKMPVPKKTNLVINEIPKDSTDVSQTDKYWGIFWKDNSDNE